MFDPLPSAVGKCTSAISSASSTKPADELDDWDDPEERYYREEIDDGRVPLAHMARLAADIEAGRAEVPNRWQLDRPSPGILVWTTPSGRRYASDLNGEPLPLP